jgi:hypothetical protein
MAGTFRNLIQRGYDMFAGEDSTNESDYLSTYTGGKRKASNDGRRPSKASRRSSGPRFSPEEYANADFFEGARERRQSGATAATVRTIDNNNNNTVLFESGTESGYVTPEPGYKPTVFNDKGKKPVTRSSSDRRASPDRVRAGRLSWLPRIPSTSFGRKLKNVDGGLDKVINEAQDVESSDVQAGLEHAREDIEDAIDKVTDVESRSPDINSVEEFTPSINEEIDDFSEHEPQEPWIPLSPIHEHQPSVEPEERPRSSLRSFGDREPSWADEPNVRARRIVKLTSSLEEAAERIKVELTEPEYAFRDVEIRDTMWQIMDETERFARHFFSEDVPHDKDELEVVFEELEPETVKIIGCVASGGPGGRDGWRDLFWDVQKRRALVCAIIGNVFSEQVFQHACFGASEKLLKELKDIQERMQDEDSKYSLGPPLPPHQPN